MRSLGLADAERPLGTLLVLGAHSDDGEIGCGGTVLHLIERHPAMRIVWVVMTAAGERAEEARRSAAALLSGAASVEIIIGGFRDGYLPYIGGPVKDFVEGLKDVRPDLVLTHQRHDLHQDHRMVCELTWNTFRDTLIVEYEIPKWDGDMGAPNVFVPVSEELAARKVAHLMEHFATQRSKRWFSEDLFMGLMRLRGMECVSPSGLAEAFYGRKVLLDV